MGAKLITQQSSALPIRGSQAGFSLLEVLVAFAILALSLGVLLQIFSKALATTAVSETYSRAVALAESKLNAMGSELPLEEGVHSGDPEGGMDWTVYVESYPIEGWLGENPPLQPYRVTAVVTWPGSARARRASLQTIRLGEAIW